MITVPEVVEDIVLESPYIVDGMSKGLINFSALARDILPEVKERLLKDVKEGAIVMALKRLSPQLRGKFADTEKFMRQIGDITVKSNLIEFTFKNSDSLINKETKLLNCINEISDNFLTISQGIQETTLIVNSKLRDVIITIFETESIILTIQNLSSITIKLPAENVEMPGVYYYMLKSLAWNGINIVEVVSTANEFTIFFHDADIDKAFAVVKKLTN